nr:carbohydrate ABC transporter permease [Alloscardovia theropitheci]
MGRQGRNSLNASSNGQKLRLSKQNRVSWPLTVLTAVLSLTVLVPLYFAFVSSLKTNATIGGLELPQIWNWDNYAKAWDLVNYPRAVWNTLIITVCATILTLLSNTFVAYAVARNIDKPFFRFMYYFFVAAMFVPFTVIMLPLAQEIGWLHLDNQLGLIILYVVLGLGTNLFIGIGFIRSIPESLEEAARIDGASTWRVFWRIIFPLMGPINATIAVMTVLWVWNDFMLPLIILTDQSNATLQLSQYVFSSQFTMNYPVAFASYLMAMAPVLIVYIFAQRWVVSGVMRGAVK